MQDNLKFKPRYEESETYKKVQGKNSGYSIHEKDLFNYLLQTYPEQAIEIQETDGDGNPITVYNEDIILLLALLAKLFGGTREVIEDLQYAYDIDYLTNQEEKSNTDNTDNLLILLANEMQFTFLNDDNQNAKIEDIKEKKRFIEQYFISKRFRGTFLAIELILNAFKEYQIKKGLGFEYEDLSKGTVTTIKISTGGEGIIDPNHTVYRTVLNNNDEEETYLSLNQNHFLYKMITNIKPAGFTYNIILDYLVDTIVVEGERIIADDEDYTFMAPKITVYTTRIPSGSVETESYDENSPLNDGDFWLIPEPHIEAHNGYDFEYWKVNEERYRGTWPISVTTDTHIEAIFYEKQDVEVEFYNTNTGAIVSSGTVQTSRTIDEPYEYSVSFIMQQLNFYPWSVDELDGQRFMGWVEAGDDQIISTNQTFTKTFVGEPPTSLKFNTLFETSQYSMFPPEPVKFEARVITPMSNDLDFYLEFRNQNGFPVDLYIKQTDNRTIVIENLGPNSVRGATFRERYTNKSKPETGRFFAYFKETSNNITSWHTPVDTKWWTMVGDYRTPGTVNVQTRIQNTSRVSIFHTGPRELPIYAYLSKITIDDHRDWRNPTHRLKLYGDTINLGKNMTNPRTTYLFDNSDNLSANIILESYETTSNITTTGITDQTINRNPDMPVRTAPDLKPLYYTTGHDSYTQTWWINLGLEARLYGLPTPFDENVLYVITTNISSYIDYGIIPAGTTYTTASIPIYKAPPTSGELKMYALVISVGSPTKEIRGDTVTAQ